MKEIKLLIIDRQDRLLHTSLCMNKIYNSDIVFEKKNGELVKIKDRFEHKESEKHMIALPKL